MALEPRQRSALSNAGQYWPVGWNPDIYTLLPRPHVVQPTGNDSPPLFLPLCRRSEMDLLDLLDLPRRGCIAASPCLLAPRFTGYHGGVLTFDLVNADSTWQTQSGLPLSPITPDTESRYLHLHWYPYGHTLKLTRMKAGWVLDMDRPAIAGQKCSVKSVTGSGFHRPTPSAPFRLNIHPCFSFYYPR